MSIRVAVTAVIYHALNGSSGPSAITKGLRVKFYLSVKGAGAWAWLSCRPKEQLLALLGLRGWPPGGCMFGAERLWHQKRGHRAGCLQVGDPPGIPGH